MSMLPYLVFLVLLGGLPVLARSVWFIPEAWPIIDSSLCFGFRAPSDSTGPTTLVVPLRGHSGELVKEMPNGLWKALETHDILPKQIVLACQCGDVFVMPVLWPPNPQRPEPWKTPCPIDIS